MTELPDGWEINRLEDLCEPGKQAIVDGPFGSNLKRSDYVDSGIPVLKIQNIKENLITLKKMDYVKPEKYEELVRHSFTEGDIVMTKLGDPLGVSAIVKGIPNGLIVADLVRIRPSKVLTKFLCYQLNSPRIQKYINEQQKGTTRPRVNLAMIRELPIYTPPIDEQHKIVVLLEDHLSRLDAALADVKQAKIRAAQFRRSTLQAAFFGYFSSEAFNLGMEIPPSWRKISLGKILQPRKQKDIPSNFPALPYIGMEHVSRDTGVIDSFGSSSAYRSSAPRVFKGDVLYGRLRPYLNKVVISPCEAFASGEFIVLPPNEEINEKFLQLRLLSQDFVEFAGTLDTGDRPRVSWEQISQFEIYLPSIDEQLKLIEILEDHLSRLEVTVTVANTIEKQSSGLRRSLLQAAFTGQLTNEVLSV